MGDEKPILYSYWRSSCSWRVRIALQLAGVEVEQRAVHLVKDGGQQLQSTYSSINPMKQVPSLVVGEECLTQSMAIMEYINELKPEAGLLPTDRIQRAKVRRLCEIINSGIQPLQNMALLKKLSDSQDERKEWAKFWIDKGFHALETELTRTAGEVCVGDQISLADCCLVPQIYNGFRFGVDMSQFPVIQRIHEKLRVMPAFVTTHPDNQPDNPDKA